MAGRTKSSLLGIGRQSIHYRWNEEAVQVMAV